MFSLWFLGVYKPTYKWGGPTRYSSHEEIAYNYKYMWVTNLNQGLHTNIPIICPAVVGKTHENPK